MKKLGTVLLIILTALSAIGLVTACSDGHEHTYAKRWSYDENYHWHAATCIHTSEKSDYGEHVFITDENGNTYCEICKYGCKHDYEVTVVAPDCEEGGYTEYYCPKCGDRYTENETPALGHDYEYTVQKEPTLTAEGSLLVVCRNDASHTEETPLPALNDSDYYAVTVKESGCETSGTVNYRYTLPNGSTVTFTASVPANGHSFDGNGVCTVCGYNANFTYTKGTDASGNKTCSITSYIGPSVASLTIPSEIEGRAVVRIASGAFASELWLESVTVPSTVTVIEEGAFCDCTNLKSVRLEMTNINLSDRAFENCTSIESAAIPNSAVHYFPKSSLKEVTVLDGEFIDVSEFEGCTALERVTLPDTIAVICSSAFKDCINLMSITVPASVTEIQPKAFENCYKLVEIFNLSALDLQAGEDGIGYYAKEILSEGDARVLENENGFIYFSFDAQTYLLHYDANETNLTLPQTLGGGSYKIYPYAFYARNEIFNITLPENLTGIGDNAFLDCVKLSEVFNNSRLDVGFDEENGCVGYYAYAIHNGQTQSVITAEGDYLFASVPEGRYLIAYTGGGKEIVLPEVFNGQAYHIGRHAFYQSGLTRITLPNAVLSIEANAFDGCGAEIVFESGSVLEKIGDYAFYGYTGDTITLPNSVTAIGAYAFGCSALQTITLPRSVKTVDATAFYECTSLDTVRYSGTLANWCAISFGTDRSDGNVTSYANPMRYASRFYLSGESTELTKITLPESITEIGDWQFMGFSRATQILMHNGIIKVGFGAFSGCAALTEITVPKNAQLSGAMLEGCVNLQTVTLPSANVIETTAVEGGTEMRFHGFGYLFGTEALDGTYGILQLYPITGNPDGFDVYVGTYYLPDSLKEVTLTGADQILYNYAFYRCKGIEKITLSQSINIIGDTAFFECTSLRELVLPASVSELGMKAFYTNKDSILHIEFGGTQAQWDALVAEAEDGIFYSYTVTCKQS